MIATHVIDEHLSISQEGMTPVHMLSGLKRMNGAMGDLERVTPTNKKKKRRTRHVSWAKQDDVRILPSNHKSFKEYKDQDIWYSRHDYEDFLLDRLQTIELLQACGGDQKALDQETCCVRGLEPFQTREGHEELSSKRKFHQSTILIEQMRQSMYGVRNPDRFRVMVGVQSEIASRRARELAVMDEHDVYGAVRRRGSVLSTPTVAKANGTKEASSSLFPGASSVDDFPSMSLEQRIRELQESNARRLIQLYSQPGYNPFKFPIRRDSLFGNSHSMVGNTSLVANRFPIRRDSLS